MSPELHQRLKYLDGLGWEYPPDLDPLAVEQILQQRPVLEAILGCRLATDGSQDCAFIADLHVLDPRFVDMKSGELTFTAIVATICIRFSAFDRMFTIFGTERENFADKIPAVIDHLTGQGFRYVSYEDLSAPYDGEHTETPDGWTWFTRFFDYL